MICTVLAVCVFTVNDITTTSLIIIYCTYVYVVNVHNMYAIHYNIIMINVLYALMHVYVRMSFSVCMYIQ